MRFISVGANFSCRCCGGGDVVLRCTPLLCAGLTGGGGGGFGVGTFGSGGALLILYLLFDSFQSQWQSGMLKKSKVMVAVTRE